MKMYKVYLTAEERKWLLEYITYCLKKFTEEDIQNSNLKALRLRYAALLKSVELAKMINLP